MRAKTEDDGAPVGTVKVRVINGMIPFEDFDNFTNKISILEPRGKNGELLPVVELVYPCEKYEIGNDMILRKMRGMFGPPKLGCKIGEAPKR